MNSRDNHLAYGLEILKIMHNNAARRVRVTIYYSSTYNTGFIVDPVFLRNLFQFNYKSITCILNVVYAY